VSDLLFSLIPHAPTCLAGGGLGRSDLGELGELLGVAGEVEAFFFGDEAVAP